jgi:toxin ParE1/3/4
LAQASQGSRLKAIKWLSKTSANRFKQLDFIAQQNPLAAISQDEQIERQVDTLIGTPPISGRPGRKRGTCELVISKTPFVAIFQVKGQTIEILYLLHSLQQWPPATKSKSTSTL